jgi:Ca-activated chloride channel homolog
MAKTMNVERHFRLIAGAFILLSPTFVSLPSLAQLIGPSIPHNSPGQQSQESLRPLRVDVEMVLVDVAVIDADGSSVTGLEKGSFRVFEDGVEQEILSFSSEDVPISIGVIFDMSGSMSDKLEESRQAALEFLKTANPRDEFFLVTFSDRAKLTSPFTFDIEELKERMLSVKPKGGTALLDAIYLGLDQMKGASNSKHALLVISDGGDNHSRYNETRIRNALKEADCSLYAIGIFRFADMWRTYEEHYGPTLLSELAGITGGRMFSVSRLDDLPAIAAKIGLELRNRYVLGYRPNNARYDGSWRRIKVNVVPPMHPQPLNVYARAGYYSPID